jgi:hypothetical protein
VGVFPMMKKITESNSSMNKKLEEIDKFIEECSQDKEEDYSNQDC